MASAKYRATEAREAAENALRTAREALAAISDAEDTLADLTADAAARQQAADTARAAADAIVEQVGAHTTERDTLLAEWDTLKQSVADVNDRLELLRKASDPSAHAECFTCGTHLTPEVAGALIASQEQELASIAARQAEVKAAGVAAKQAITELTGERERLLRDAAEAADAAKTAGAKLARVEALLASKAEKKAAETTAIQTLSRVVADESEELDIAADQKSDAHAAAETEQTTAIAAAETALDAANTAVTANSEPDANETKLAKALAEAEARVAAGAETVATQRIAYEQERGTLREEGQALSRETVRREEAATLRAEQQDRLTALQAERAEAETERLTYATLEAAFRPTGIPAMILAGVVEELNEAVNISLNRLSRGDLSVEIRASRETTSGSTENKVFVYVETPDGIRAYESLSGGQKFRVDLAIRMGLAQAIAHGTGTPIRTFILDEGWGSLDERGILSTIETLFRLSEETNVITVSHIGQVKDEFPARVEVSLVGRNSVAEVVAA